MQSVNTISSLVDKFITYTIDVDYTNSVGRYIHKTEEGTQWITVRNDYLSADTLKTLVLRHLTGRRYLLGTGFSEKTRFVILDLDFYLSEEELDSRCSRVRRALSLFFNEPQVIVRSSRKGGRHLRWILNNPLDRVQLHLFVKKLLKTQGIELQRGKVELFPGINHKCIRLPLGKGSAILDRNYNVLWEHGDPLVTGLSNYLLSCQSTVDVLPIVRSKEWSHKEAEQSSSINSEQQQADKNPFERSREIWLKYGLTDASQKLRALTDLAIFFWHQGYNQTEAIDSLRNWLKHNNNGFSKDFNSYPTRELTTTIPGVVDFIFSSADRQSFRRKREENRKNLVPQPLSEIDIDKILAITSNYNQQVGFFSLLSYIKTNSVKNKIVLHCLTLNNLEGCSMYSRTTLIKKLCDIGAIRLLEDYDKHKKRARVYEVQWEFTESGKSYTSLLEFLTERFTHTELVRRYNRYRAISIRKQVTNLTKCGIVEESITSHETNHVETTN